MLADALRSFLAYDIRGRVPEELNEDLAWRIGNVFAGLRGARRVAVGRDCRLSSPALAAALARGLQDAGAEVWDLGLCGTEEVYFAVADLDLDGGIMVTASHNPAEYNGMKLVGRQARPVSGDSGLFDIRDAVARGDRFSGPPGTLRPLDIHDRFLDKLLGMVRPQALRPFRVVCNAGNGAVGPLLEKLRPRLPIHMTVLLGEPDGTFPHGVPNPLLPENREMTARAVREEGADLGVAWDGDFDRCFFFDEKGQFVEGYYLVGLFAGHFLARYPGAKILHDPRLTWNTIEIVTQAGGIPVQSKTGHAFIKERMRAEDAVYGGEMSAHHYFRDFAYCDSGLLPWLLLMEIMSESGRSLSELVAERQRRYPVSGEINRRVADQKAVLARVRAEYEGQAIKIEEVDGLSLEFPQWRFNLRSSNTEPILRLNVETRGDPELLARKTAELLARIEG